ncbi:MAG: hypothetical protein ACFBSE_17495 [Prochloraceae cyanobacterium]
MEEYFSRFLEMVEELKSSPYVQVLNFELFEAVEPKVITRVEEILRCNLDTSIKDFYQISNGLQLKWIHKKNPEFDSEEHYYREEGFDYLQPIEEYGLEDGCINILPLQVTLFEQNWSDIVWSYEDEGYSVEFCGAIHDRLALMQRLKPLDIFSKSEAMAFLIEEGIGNPKVILVQDHFAEVEDSRITDFRSYLDFILHYRGLIAERRNFYNEYKGHRIPTIRTTLEYWANDQRQDLQFLY